MNKVVKLSIDNDIAVVSMLEREFKNTFSEGLIAGLKEAFGNISRSPDIRAVVIHGYDNYFCAGGTKEELVSIYQGELKFTDIKLYELILQCEVPVISAMQGHAIGGGLAFGCYADMFVMAEEAIYSCNFMKYGFTPGFGSTYIIRKKFGNVLGDEMLISARNYYGREIKSRGAGINVVKKSDVISTALELAAEISDKPVYSLKLLKKHLIRDTVADLNKVVDLELDMHEKTFHRVEVRDRIERMFDGG